MSNELGDVQEALGTMIMPVVLPAIQKLKKFAGALNAQFEKMSPQIKKVAGVIVVASVAILGLGAAFGLLMTSIAPVIGAGLVPLIALVGGLAVGIIAAVAAVQLFVWGMQGLG